MLEIIGFWTPENLQEKARVLQQFRHQSILLAISKPLKDRLKVPQELPVVYFKNRLDPVEVLKTVALLRDDVQSDQPLGGITWRILLYILCIHVDSLLFENGCIGTKPE
jgi:hypothetical protein